MLIPNKHISHFTQTIWAAFAVFAAVCITFGIYVYAEKQIGKADEQRKKSHELAHELRQASDDLSRMARTYVLTADPIYKRHFQEIIDIRDGAAPHPIDYDHIYWDLVLSDDKRPRGNTAPIALFQMMSNAGFTNEEFGKISIAKQYSDELALSEYAAMYLVESDPKDTNGDRAKAYKMLFDADYHKTKSKIMKAISDFSNMVEDRTDAAVHNAVTIALISRLAFIVLSLLLIFLLWRISRLLQNVLGGSIAQIHTHISHLGSGQHSVPITVPKGHENSVLGWLAQTQTKLSVLNEEHSAALKQTQRLTQMYAALSQCNQAIVHATNQEELFATICQNAITFGPMKMAWIGMYDEPSQLFHAVAYAGEGTDYLKNLIVSIEESSLFGQGPTGTAFRQNEPYWCQDFQNDPKTTPWKARAATYAWNSSAALPLHLNGNVVGVLSLYSDELNAFDESIQELLLEMAMDISFALNNFAHDAARNTAEQNLSASYQLLHSIINTAPVRIFWKDLNLRYLGCNDAFAQDAGKTNPQELIGKDDTQMTWEEQALLYQADDRKVIQSGIPKLFFEEPQTTPTGEKIWLSTSKVPLYDNNKNIIGILGMYQDITDRKKAENALIESEQRLSAIIQTEPECVKIVDARGKLTQMNPAGLAMLEAQTLEEAQQYGLTDYLLPQYRAGFIALHHTVMGGENGTFEFEVTGLKGSRRWLETHATPMRNAKGEVTSLLGATRDITQRKADENTRILQTQAMEQSPNAVIITDFKANIEYVNTAFIQNTGYTLEEVIGQNPRLLKSGNTPAHAYDEMWTALVKQEKWQGEFINKRKDGTNYIYSINVAPVIDHTGKTTHYIAIEEDISEQKKTQEKIHYLANYDVLTGLPNRIQMDDHLQYTLNLAKRNEGYFAIIFLDLDHFKAINDTLGHSVGDLLLMELSQRLNFAIREEDTASRMGGDEFVLLLPQTDANGAAQVAQKLLSSISKTFLIEDHELSVTASLGIALYPSDGSDIETLSKNADVAMYRAKQEGRNAYCFFTNEMQQNSQRNLELSNALHNALQRNEFHLVYQPQFRAKDGSVIGAEALIRWEHPQLGFVSPAEFIPIAEDNGTILSIGEWVLRTAVSQASQWHQNAMPLIMAVNLSAVQFRHPNLPSLITDILKEAGLSPQYLEIELTEGVAMHDPKDAINIMNALHEIGVRMSIDDFGTGYSSLAYLKQFKVYKLKIDQSFVRDISTDPEDKAIVNAIIQLGHSLDLITIAEGVETLDQLQYLQKQACDEIQGYYYSKPLLATMFEKFYHSHTTTQTTKE